MNDQQRTIHRCWILAVFMHAGITFTYASPINFEKQVLPIFKKHCFKCHQEAKVVNGTLQKPKEGLRLDSARAIVMGSENGKIVIPKKPKQSALYRNVTLPRDHDDAMPPKGDGLSKKEAYMIGKWIAEGARFGTWRGNERGLPDKPKRARKSSPPSNSPAIPKAPNQILEDTGASVRPMHPGSKLLAVEFATESPLVDDDAMGGLKGIEYRIGELDISRTSITGKGLKRVASMKNLLRLNLFGSKIGDEDLVHLQRLISLNSLNLAGTQISDAGIKYLRSLKNLKVLYLWGTRISADGRFVLGQALPNTELVFE